MFSVIICIFCKKKNGKFILSDILVSTLNIGFNAKAPDSNIVLLLLFQWLNIKIIFLLPKYQIFDPIPKYPWFEFRF